jgi:hypothetical protein
MSSQAISYVLMVMNGPEDGRIYEINKEKISIGGSEKDDIKLNSDPALQQAQAFISKENGQFKLINNDPFSNKNMLILPGKCFTVGETELLIKLKYQV